MVSGGWITQADRSRWQQRAVAELAAILDAHPGIPVIAWTVSPAGGALSGQVLAAAGRRGLFGNRGRPWAWASSPRTRRGRTADYLHARGVHGGVAVSITATVFDDGEDSQ